MDNASRLVDNKCPSCQGNDTQTLSMAFHRGTSSKDQSALASALAPPVLRPQYPLQLFLIFGISFLIGITLLIYSEFASVLFYLSIAVILAGLIISAVIYFRAMQDAKTVLGVESDNWQRSWICNQCGQIWLP